MRKARHGENSLVNLELVCDDPDPLVWAVLHVLVVLGWGYEPARRGAADVPGEGVGVVRDLPAVLEQLELAQWLAHARRHLVLPLQPLGVDDAAHEQEASAELAQAAARLRQAEQRERVQAVADVVEHVGGQVEEQRRGGGRGGQAEGERAGLRAADEAGLRVRQVGVPVGVVAAEEEVELLLEVGAAVLRHGALQVDVVGARQERVVQQRVVVRVLVAADQLPAEAGEGGLCGKGFH